MFFCKKHFKSQKLTWGNKKSYLLFFFSFANFEKKPGYTVFIWTGKKMNFILNVFAFKINLIYIQPCFPKTSLISQKKMKRFCQFRLKKKQCKNLQNYHSYKNLNKMSFQKYIFCRSFKRKCITMDRWHIFTFHEVYLKRRQNHWQNIFLLYFKKEIQLK